jgi:hypothetical protein
LAVNNYKRARNKMPLELAEQLPATLKLPTAMAEVVKEKPVEFKSGVDLFCERLFRSVSQ